MENLLKDINPAFTDETLDLLYKYIINRYNKESLDNCVNALNSESVQTAISNLVNEQICKNIN